MLEKNILETVLEIACSTAGDFAEIFEETNYSTRISMLNDDVESTNSGIRYGLGLRIYHGLESLRVLFWVRLSELFWEVMNFPADFLLSIFLL